MKRGQKLQKLLDAFREFLGQTCKAPEQNVSNYPIKNHPTIEINGVLHSIALEFTNIHLFLLQSRLTVHFLNKYLH